MNFRRLFFFIVICGSLRAQTIVFSYDAGGNMIERKLQVIPGGRLGNFGAPNDTTNSEPINFKVFPNPTNTSITIAGELPPNIGEAKVYLLNVGGQVLKQDVYIGQSKSLNVQDLKSGIYFLELIYSQKKKSTYKIIVTN